MNRVVEWIGDHLVQIICAALSGGVILYFIQYYLSSSSLTLTQTVHEKIFYDGPAPKSVKVCYTSGTADFVYIVTGKGSDELQRTLGKVERGTDCPIYTHKRVWAKLDLVSEDSRRSCKADVLRCYAELEFRILPDD